MEEEAFMTKQHILQTVWRSVASVGWYVVAVIIALVYSWPYIYEKYANWKHKLDEQQYNAKYHKDPDIMQQRNNKIELARQRMQEKYNKDLELAEQKEQELKEKKRQEALNKIMDSEEGYKLGGDENSTEGSSKLKSKSRLLQNDYNPLMGGSSNRYRPPKRSCCGSSRGGCG